MVIETFTPPARYPPSGAVTSDSLSSPSSRPPRQSSVLAPLTFSSPHSPLLAHRAGPAHTFLS
eukprot:scaffold177291_cov27-Tisochrysis_lutea.AAC.1